MSKKYKLTSETITHNWVTLYRIESLKDFGNVTIWKLGWFVEKEENLSHEDDAWVSGNAWVSGDAQVSGNAWVFGDAKIYCGSNL